MAGKTWIAALVFVLLLTGFCQTGLAVVMTGTPEDSWAYSVLVPAGQTGSISYFPQVRADFSGAVFQGYGTYEAGREVFVTGNIPDTMNVFETYALSTTDITLSLALAGDDGHSLFVDDGFVSGGGYGVVASYDLVLQAGTARKLELIGYNAIGPSVFHIGLADPTQQPNGISGTINDVPGVYLNAEGDFSHVPEPTSLVLWSGLCMMGLIAARRRKRTA